MLPQPIRQLDDQLGHRNALPPFLRDAIYAVVRAGDLAVDGGGGVGVVAQVHRQQAAIAEVG